jgi:hypothetical protein
MYKMASTLVMALGLTSLWAQQQSNKQIGLGTGLSYYAEKSELYSPVTHKGSSAPMQLFFRFNGQKDRHHIQLQYSSLDLNSPSTGFVPQKRIIYLQYAYHRKFASANNKFNFFGGIVLNSAGERHNVSGNINAAGNDSYDEFNSSLCPSVLGETSLGKDILTVQCWVSLLTYTVEPGYAEGLPYKANWMGINSYSKIGSRISYTTSISHRFDIRGDYQFEFCRSVKYEPVTSLNHQVIISLVYKIY